MRAALVGLLVVLVALTAPLVTASADAPAPPPYILLVNANNPTTAASRKFLTDAFLKKTTRWPNGDVIRPVDQSGDSGVRARFTEDILKRSVAAVKSYWQQIVFSGRDLPPPELGSDDEIVKFVASHPGAVGYVATFAGASDVKRMSVE